MIVKLEFSEQVKYSTTVRLTKAQVEASYEAAGVTEEDRLVKRLDAIATYMFATDATDPDSERWFAELERQRPAWPLGDGGEVTVEVNARRLDDVAIVNADG